MRDILRFLLEIQAACLELLKNYYIIIKRIDKFFYFSHIIFTNFIIFLYFWAHNLYAY